MLVRELEASDRKLECASLDWWSCAEARLVEQARRAVLQWPELVLQVRLEHEALREQLARGRVLRQQVLLVLLRQQARV